MRKVMYLVFVALLPLLLTCTQIPSGLGSLDYNKVKRGMEFVNGGTFSMGQTGIAVPVRQVTVSSFYIDNTDVTQGDYLELMGVNPSFFGGDSLLPVVSVTWFDAALYCNARSRSEGLDTVYSYSAVSGVPGNGCDTLRGLVIDYSKKGYRLPTEAEWEYACRAGTTTRYYWGDVMDLDYCWDTTNSGGRPHPVGQTPPNHLGLYDMSGNVWQWCNDWFGVYGSANQTDPTGPVTGTSRLLRGGSWYVHDYQACAAYRASNVPGKRFFDVGFRCVSAQSVLPPVLSSPANRATGQPQSLTLSWLPVSNATGYFMQVSTDSSFSSVLIEDSTLATASKTIGNLAPGVTYYWRVRAKNTSGAGAWSGAWSFVTAAASPDSMKSVAGGTFTMGSNDGLDYNGSPAHQVMVSSFYIDSVPVSQAVYIALMGVNPSSFSGVLTRPVEQVTWFDAALFCNARSKKERKDTVYTFNSISGPIGSGCTALGNLQVDYAKNGYRLPTDAEFEYAHRAGTTTPYFWGNDTSAAGVYAWWKGNSPTSTQAVATKAPNGWKLYDMSGNVWEWCNDWFAAYTSSAQIDPTGPPTGTARVLRGGSWRDFGGALRSAYRSSAAPGVIFSSYGFRCVRKYFAAAALPAPTQISPANGAVAQSQTPTLTWSTVSTATSYRVQVSPDSSFASVFFEDSTLTSVSRTTGVLSLGVKYFWRVRAKNASGVSAWTAPWSFTTTPPAVPAAPSLTSPANGSATQSLTPALVWSTVSGASTYYVQVSTSNTFAVIFLQDSTLTSDSLKLGGLATGTTYYWRVRAKNVSGASVWAGPWSFTTTLQAIPSVPSLVSPANGSTGQSLAPTLDWLPVSGASTYYVQVSTSNTFAAIFFQDSTLTADSTRLSRLSAGTTYYWRVRAKNASGVSAWTSPWSLATSATALQSPTLFSPANGATGVSMPATLTWSTVAGATNYHVQVSRDSLFTSNLSNDSTLTAASKTLNLPPGSYGNTLYWRVRAKNANGVSAWTATWVFYSGGTLPAPVLNSPANAATGVSMPATLTWSTVTGATSYHVQVSVSGTFTTLAAEDSTLTAASKSVSGLAASTTHYWRVRAKNSGGAGAWTSPWNFTTAMPSLPSAPSLVSPANGATNQSRRPTLIWSSVSGATSYHVQVSVNPGFTVIAAVDSAVTSTSKTLDSLLVAAGGYYWRVRAKNAAGVSAWTSAWNFSATPGAGPWFTKASMPTARYGMGIAVLNDKIYVLGGINGSGPIATVEVYDPGTDTWSAKPDMPTPRNPAAAVVNDNIYVIGGDAIGTTVQMYDPSANTWTDMASMPTVRQPFVAVVNLIKIYAIGGYNTTSGSLGTNEEYDPSLDTWTSNAGMTPRNSAPAAAALNKVYVFGGEYSPNTPLSLVEEYDPSTDTWMTRTDMPTARRRPAAAAANDSIYVIGGSDNGGDLATVELYDPSTDTWATKSSMPTPRSSPAVAVVNGKIYVIGGFNSSSSPVLTMVEEYDPLLDP